MEKFSLWDVYLNPQMADWLWRHCKTYVNERRNRFDDCLDIARDEFIRESSAVEIVSVGGRHPIVEYVGRGGRKFQTQLRWWIVRRIRSLCGKKADVASRFVEQRGEAASPSLPHSHSMCAAIREFFGRISACLNSLSEGERRVIFYDLRFGPKQTKNISVANRWLSEDLAENSEDEYIEGALPDECADSILADHHLTDVQLSEWFQTRTAPVYDLRYNAKKRLINCLLRSYGERWKSILTGNAETGELAL